MQGQAQGHHVGVEPAELQGGGMLWQGAQSHLEEVHRELAVDVSGACTCSCRSFQLGLSYRPF